LPFTDSPPAWDGAYPYVSISLIDSGSGHFTFKTFISRIKPTVHHDSSVNEVQVDLHSGMFVLRQTDFFISDVMPLSLTRTYRAWDLHARAFGAGTNHPYDICPTGTRFPYTDQDLNLEDGRAIHFRRISKGSGFADAVFRHEETSSEFYGAQNAWNGDGWTLTFRNGERFLFPEAYFSKNYAQGAPFAMEDAGGHRIQLKRDQQRNLEQLVSPAGRQINFKYDRADRIVEAADDAGRVRKYSYDSSGHMVTVSDASHLLYRFEYQRLSQAAGCDPYFMTAILDENWKVLVRNVYKDRSRVSEQRLADGEVFRYDYIFDAKHDINLTFVTLPDGSKRKFSFKHGIPEEEE
jgi:YD repeat-containing protein